MIIKNRLTKFLGIVTGILILFIGCTNQITSIGTNTPEEAIELFNRYNVEDNIEKMISLYSNAYINSTGYSKKQIVRSFKNTRDKVDVTKSEVESIEDIDENLKLAKVKITANIDGKENIDIYTYAIIKEEDGWSVSPDGIIETNNYDVPAPKDKELNINLSKVITTFEGAIIKCNVINNSKNAFTFGSKGEKCEVVVETSEGTFSTFMDEEVRLDRNASNYVIIRIKELVGDVNKLTVKSVYELDSNGNAVLDSYKDIVIYEK